jgi:hypothetical protein
MGQGLTPQTLAFINEKFGHSPELKEAALARAEVKEERLLQETLTGVFNKKLALQDAHALLCLDIKIERLEPARMTTSEIAVF